MSKINLSKILHSTKESVSKHSPEILTAFGIGGMLTAVIFAVKATPKAMEIVRIERRDGGIVDKETGRVSYAKYVPRRLTTKEIVKMVWKCYIPTAVTFTVSAGCLICANSVNNKQKAALATAYTLSETAFSAYKEKVLETIGDAGEQAIRDTIAKDKIENNPPAIEKEIVFVDSSDVLCFDSISGRYFTSSIDKLNKAANELSRRLMDEMYISLNDFYYEIGLRNTKLGDDLGWHVENGLIDLNFSTQMAPEGKPCIVIDYVIMPRYDYK